MSSLALSDKIVFVLYFLIVASYGYWVYRKKKDTVSASQDFFLAEGSLTWWAIGASLIASNISAEQFIGMSGEGFFVGVAIAAYEWIAALGLIIIAVWFIPIYLKNKIYTMPQFLKTRYNESVALPGPLSLHGQLRDPPLAQPPALLRLPAAARSSTSPRA